MRPPTASARGQAWLPAPGVLQAEGSTLVLIHALLKRGVDDARRRDGYPPPPEVYRVLAVTAAGAQDVMSGRGRAFAVEWEGEEASKAEPDTEPAAMTTKDAAEALGLSERQVRRLAERQLGGWRHGNAYVFDPATVRAHAATRKDTPHAHRRDHHPELGQPRREGHDRPVQAESDRR